MRFLLLTALLCASASLTATMSVARDVALFIENTDYAREADLPAVRGVNGLKNTLKARDFRVIEGRDLKADQMREVARRLMSSVQTADRAFVFLHGHFAHTDSNTWMLSRNHRGNDLFDTSHSALSLRTLADVIAPAAGRAVIFVATSDRKANVGAGLGAGARMVEMPQGVTLVMGPAAQLVELAQSRLFNPSQSMRQALGTAPNSISVDGFLSPSVSYLAQNVAVAERPKPVDPDGQAWARAEAANTPQAYLTYLQGFPNGRYVNDARNRLLAQTAPSEPTPAEIEADLNMSRAVRRDVQATLNGLGYNVGSPDGVFGPATRRGITGWQGQTGFKETGYLTQAALNQLQQSGKRLRDIENQAWQTALNANTENAYAGYLQSYPTGTYANEAKARIAALQGPVVSQQDVARAQAEERRVTSLKLTRSLIENMLAAQGFNPGSRDGNFDQRTRRAILAYQEARGITPTGYVDQATMTKLLGG